MSSFECKVKVKWREIQTEYSKVRYCYLITIKIGRPDFNIHGFLSLLQNWIDGAPIQLKILISPELSRQSCEIRDLLKCKSRLALDKVNDFKGLKSCKILMLWCLFKGYTLSMLISFIKEIEFSLILMAFLLYLMQVRTCIVIGEVSYFTTLSR